LLPDQFPLEGKSRITISVKSGDLTAVRQYAAATHAPNTPAPSDQKSAPKIRSQISIQRLKSTRTPLPWPFC